MKEILKKCFENGVSMTVRPERDSGYLTFKLRKGDYCTIFGLSYDEICDLNAEYDYILNQRIDKFLEEYDEKFKLKTGGQYMVCFDSHGEMSYKFKEFGYTISLENSVCIKTFDNVRRVIEMKDGTLFKFVNFNESEKIVGFRGELIRYDQFVDLFFKSVEKIKESQHIVNKPAYSDKLSCLSCEYLINTPVHQEPCKSCGKYKS